MKRVKEMMTLIAVLAVTVVLFGSCSKDDDGGSKTPLEENYFTIENAEVRNGSIPAASANAEPLAVSINRNALVGGPSVVTFSQEVKEVYVSVRGLNQYFAVTPTQAGGDLRAAAAEVLYTIVLNYSQNLQDFDIQIAAMLSDGTITTVYETSINILEAGNSSQGALQVSLSFDALKDVDLYLICPDGEIIYYGNRGVYATDEDGSYIYNEDGKRVMLWGLDVDSNAGCGIDSINNENIYLPKEHIVTGKYEVWVNMYSNCSPRTMPTYWVITALKDGTRVPVSFGSNPASGVYAADVASNGIGAPYYDGVLRGATKVMEFNLQGTAQSTRSARAIAGEPVPLTESAKLKLQAAGELR